MVKAATLSTPKTLKHINPHPVLSGSHGHVEANETSSLFVSFIVVSDGSNPACTTGK